jgi:phosphatidylethanolamine/phosphatidyl-N-methylethanolamine N-methyltransferase
LTAPATYARLAPFYDFVYGFGLSHGRRCAMKRLAPRPGERILEIGTGTGLSALEYPLPCSVVAIDLSPAMLERARSRLATFDAGHIRLCRMDAMHLAFPDGVFDAVYAPYVVNVVREPFAALREMRRVCRPNGRIVLLNHFSGTGRDGKVSKLLGRFASVAGDAKWDLNLQLLEQAQLRPHSMEHVNIGGVSSVVVCRRA